MKKTDYLINSKVMNMDGLPVLMALPVALVGVVLIGSLIPAAYAADKTEEIWQRVTK